MGKRGPRSNHPSGNGHTTKKGYHRIYEGGRLRMDHVVEWERHNGPVPAGHQIHHVDDDKQHNDPGNLESVNATTHKRIHSGCELRSGIWWKPCKLCGAFKPIDRDHWYLSKEGWPLYGRCRPCHVARVVSDKRKRRALRKLRSADQVDAPNGQAD